MASDPPSDPFRVRLNWPEHDLVPATRRDQQADEPAEDAKDTRDEPTLAYEPEDVPDAGGSVLFTVASRLEGLRAALGNIAVRLDSLIRREEQFREFTSTRLAENAEQVALAVGSTKSAIEDQAREQQQVIDAVSSLRDKLENDASSLRERLEDDSKRNRELLEGLANTLTDTARQLSEDVEVVRAELVASVARTEARDEELSVEVGHVAEELRVLRRRMTVRAKPVGRSVDEEPVDQDQDFNPPAPTRGRIRRPRGE
jgi:archaellum component FlaC